MQKPRNSRPKQNAKPGPSPIEILPPSGEDSTGGAMPNIYADIAAQINQYTDRPDLLLETLERHDPGFIKAMNEDARDYAKKSRNSRFNFGRSQAYASLFLQVAAAAAIIFIIYILAEKGLLSFWLILGFALFYAISQAGTSGFLRVIDQLHKILSGKRP